MHHQGVSSLAVQEAKDPMFIGDWYDLHDVHAKHAAYHVVKLATMSKLCPTVGQCMITVGEALLLPWLQCRHASQPIFYAPGRAHSNGPFPCLHHLSINHDA